MKIRPPGGRLRLGTRQAPQQHWLRGAATPSDWVWKVGVPTILLLVALLPRVWAFGSLTNPDEIRWLERSVEFYDALDRGDWAATLEAFHPGIVPAWGFGALLCIRYGLPQLQAWSAADALPMADLARTALFFPVLVSVLTVLAVYGLVWRLGGREAALYAGLLLALEPYYLAFTHAIHLDLSQASLMAVAALLWLNYLQPPRRLAFALGSGFVAGLALLTRTAALYLVPFTLLAAGVHFLGDNRVERNLHLSAGWVRRLARLVPAWLAWLAILALTVFGLWPALWVRPEAVGQWVGEGILRSVSNPHAAPAYFLGQTITGDPGVFYYLLILLFRLRPATLALASLSPLLLALGWRRISPAQRLSWLLGLLYAACYFLQMSLAPHKLERYLVPLAVALPILAGVGLAVVIRRVAAAMGRTGDDPRFKAARMILAGAAIVLLAIPWLRLAPAYAAYFNPLVGGGRQAAELFTVGGGEGLDQAASYLNGKPNADGLLALSFYPQIFGYYFEGRTQSPRYSSWSGLPVAADYVVVTSAQAQRGIYPSTLDFFLPRQPEHTVQINGVDYARVYPVPRQPLNSPPPIQHPMDANFEHRVHLIGYDLTREPGLNLTLYWQLIVAVPEQIRVRIRVVDGSGAMIAEQSDPPWSGEVAVLSWPGGLAVRDQHTVSLPESFRAGSYGLLLSLEQRDEEGQVRLLKLEGDGGTEVGLGPFSLP